MFLKNFLKTFGIWGDFYQTLAKDDRQDCQNCIPCVDRNFLRNTFLRKNPHLLQWTLSEKSAKFRQKTVVKVVATAFYLSTINRTPKNMFFFKKIQFLNNFELWASSFGFFAKKVLWTFSKLHSTCPTIQLEEECLFFEKFFLDLFGFLSKKRIRLLSGMLRQVCQNCNLPVETVSFG